MKAAAAVREYPTLDENERKAEMHGSRACGKEKHDEGRFSSADASVLDGGEGGAEI